ncbi:MAG: multiheme c-type cytochrome [Candidatus Binatia bacterium]
MSTTGRRHHRIGALTALALLMMVIPSAAQPYPTTRRDFELPGTQPLTVSANFAVPSTCAPCHSNYGQPNVEPFRNWQGSMMAHSGRDPLMLAALAVANQDLEHAGETCLRCHFPKGWLEGRSAPEDGTMMTADDRQGVQCTICHRLVDPVADPENPPEDGPILSALLQPVPTFGSAMMVVDPQDRLRGPFDIIADLGNDPHLPARSTLVSPYHKSSELCGTCHNVRNPAFTRNMLGEYALNAIDTPADPTLGFPEQSTFDEWAASTYAVTGVSAPQFGRNRDVVSTCQDCHMPAVTGKDANLGITRNDVPLHELVGGNTFIPTILPHHPVFGAEVSAAILQESVEKSTTILRKAATLGLDLAGGVLTVRVTNESGHKLPSGYPDGRRMWLHVRAFDAARNVVFESGRYVFATGDLVGYEAVPTDQDYDPNLHVWEAVHGMSPAAAAAFGSTPGASRHLVKNNVRVKDNRIPPRGFTNAAFEAFDGAPVGDTYADGAYWDDVTYPVGAAAVGAEVTLFYQTTSREYVEFLRDENTTNAAGNVLFDLWDDHGKSAPVEMAHAFLEPDARKIAKCKTAVARGQDRFRKTYSKEWGKCFAVRAQGLSCDTAVRDARVTAAQAKLRDKIGGPKDRVCSGQNITPITLGHGNTCPVPCATTVLFDMTDVADCSICMAAAAESEELNAAYGIRPPSLPSTVGSSALECQKALAKAVDGLASGWARALANCEDANARGVNAPALDCPTDPSGGIAHAKAKSASRVATCDSFTGLTGCATSGSAAGTTACFENAIGPITERYTGVAYP